MTASNIPSDFDWVTARAACSPETQYVALRQFVKTNVAQRNAALGRERFGFKTAAQNDQDPAAFHVWDREVRVRERVAVDFRLLGDEIEISMPNGKNLLVLVVLTDDGRCRFRLLGEDLELWQVARRALEELLFN